MKEYLSYDIVQLHNLMIRSVGAGRTMRNRNAFQHLWNAAHHGVSV